MASKFFRAASSGELWGQLAPPIQMSPEHLPGLRDARGKEDAIPALLGGESCPLKLRPSVAST